MTNKNIYIKYYNFKYNIEKIVNIIDNFKMIFIKEKINKSIKKNNKKYKILIYKNFKKTNEKIIKLKLFNKKVLNRLKFSWMRQWGYFWLKDLT